MFLQHTKNLTYCLHIVAELIASVINNLKMRCRTHCVQAASYFIIAISHRKQTDPQRGVAVTTWSYNANWPSVLTFTGLKLKPEPEFWLHTYLDFCISPLFQVPRVEAEKSIIHRHTLCIQLGKHTQYSYRYVAEGQYRIYKTLAIFAGNSIIRPLRNIVSGSTNKSRKAKKQIPSYQLAKQAFQIVIFLR